MFRPLNGIKVIDLTTVLAGPYCTYQLGLLGAEIIKIENITDGDWTRESGKDEALNDVLMGSAFLVQNSNKKSIQIDLKTPKGKEIAHKLIQTADVFVENMRPGKAEKLGLGWDCLANLNNTLLVKLLQLWMPHKLLMIFYLLDYIFSYLEILWHKLRKYLLYFHIYNNQKLKIIPIDWASPLGIP